MGETNYSIEGFSSLDEKALNKIIYGEPVFGIRILTSVGSNAEFDTMDDAIDYYRENKDSILKQYDYMKVFMLMEKHDNIMKCVKILYNATNMDLSGLDPSLTDIMEADDTEKYHLVLVIVRRDGHEIIVRYVENTDKEVVDSIDTHNDDNDECYEFETEKEANDFFKRNEIEILDTIKEGYELQRVIVAKGRIIVGLHSPSDLK